MTGPTTGPPLFEAREPARPRRLAGSLGRPWVRSLRIPVALYAASRVATFAAVRFVSALRGGRAATRILTSWDGHWYVRIAAMGYPDHIPTHHGKAVFSEIPFFPLYPVMVRALDTVTPFDVRTTAIVLAVVLGAVAAAALWLVTRRLFDEATATRAVALLCFAPGAWVFTFAYSEGLMLLLSVATLWLLHERRWLAAGIVGALGTASRPNAVVLAACAVWAAAVAIRRDRDWRSLVAVALTPIGTLGFLGYLWIHTGEGDAWFRVQREAWGEHVDWGKSTLHIMRVFVSYPLQSPDDLVIGLSTVLAVVMCCLLVRARLPGVFVVYTAGILGLAATSAVLLPRPRFVLVAFPLVIATARFVRGRRLALLLAVTGGLMVILVVWYGYSWGPLAPIPP